MRRFAAIFSAAALSGLSLSACATAPGTSISPRAAAAFVATAASSDMYEIESSRLALQRSRAPMLRMHAEMMIRDHTNMSAQLKAAAASTGLGVPVQMLPMHAQMLADLQRSTNFDATYRAQQISSHREALALMDKYARRGDVPRLRGVAAAAIPVIRGHLDHAQRAGF